MTAQQIKYIQDLFPSYKNTDALNLSKIQALNGLSDSIMSSTIGGVIGADNYDSIFKPETTVVNGTVSDGSNPKVPKGYIKVTGGWVPPTSSGTGYTAPSWAIQP